MSERFPGSERNLKLVKIEDISGGRDDMVKKPAPPRDAYFHPLFAPHSQSSSVGRAKMQSLGFKPVNIFRRP